MLILLYIMMFFVAIGCIYGIIRTIKICLLFKQGHNPFCRICKKCGAHQVQYQSNIEGMEDNTWWEDVYPIGNDENCKCHSYAEYHQ